MTAAASKGGARGGKGLQAQNKANRMLLYILALFVLGMVGLAVANATGVV
jgi:hypothetical protein